MIKSCVAFSWFAVGVAAASSHAVAATTYKVVASLSHSDHVFGTPVVIVKPDTPAQITVTGPNGYDLQITVSPAGADKLKVATTLHSQYGSMSPVLVVRPGEPASVSYGGMSILLTAQVVGS